MKNMVNSGLIVAFDKSPDICKTRMVTKMAGNSFLNAKINS